MAKYFKFDPTHVKYGRYSNGRVAISLVSPIEGPMCKATVNIPDVAVPEGYVLIKDYSENTGVLADLCGCGIVEDTGKLIRVSAFVSVNLVKLLQDY